VIQKQKSACLPILSLFFPIWVLLQGSQSSANDDSIQKFLDVMNAPLYSWTCYGDHTLKDCFLSGTEEFDLECGCLQFGGNNPEVRADEGALDPSKLCTSVTQGKLRNIHCSLPKEYATAYQDHTLANQSVQCIQSRKECPSGYTKVHECHGKSLVLFKNNLCKMTPAKAAAPGSVEKSIFQNSAAPAK